MKIAFCGMGKLGWPVAMTWAEAGHEVVGYDISPSAKEILASRKYPNHTEARAQEMLEKTTVKIVGSIAEAVAFSDLVFVAVQTPHGPEYEGATRMPETRADFDYAALRRAVLSIAAEATHQCKHITLVVISTVLPGTSARELLPIIRNNRFISFVYAPMFIAMGTVEKDTRNPEFVLLGIDKSDARGVEEAKSFFSSMHAPEKLRLMSVASAELTKVAYNVALSIKISIANSIMEIAHHTGANCDEVTDALAKATDRVISAKYLRGGMPDAGPCFIEGELIHVEDGIRAVDEIEKGDRVLGGDGFYHEVIETYRRPFKGRVYTIKGRGLARFTVTGNHPVYVARDHRPILSNGRRNQNEGPVLGPIEQIPAESIREDCYILTPTPREVTARESWTPPRGRSGPAPHPIFVDNEAYTLVAGYFMGEGCIWYDRSKNYIPARVSFSFNTLTDGDYIAECVNALKIVAPKSKITIATKNERETCTDIRVNSSQLARMLDHDCGHGYENKHIPAWIINNDRNSSLCLRALFRGDGSSHGEGISFSSISPHLAHGVQFMLRRHGIPSTLQFHPKRIGSDGTPHRAAYDLGVNNAAHIEKLSEIIGMPIRHQMQEKRYPNTIFERDGFWYHYANSIETSEYEGTVYNLNVADVHNYVSVGGLVANCHPRDIIALSWLSEEAGLCGDFFGSMVRWREAQAEFIANLCETEAQTSDLPVVVLGRAYKKGTNLTVGSSAILLKNILDENNPLPASDQWDPNTDPPRTFRTPAVFVVATDHDYFYSLSFTGSLPKGSTIIDPWGKMHDIDGCTVIRVGRG